MLVGNKFRKIKEHFKQVFSLEKLNSVRSFLIVREISFHDTGLYIFLPNDL